MLPTRSADDHPSSRLDNRWRPKSNFLGPKSVCNRISCLRTDGLNKEFGTNNTLQRARAGEKAAFGDLVREHQRLVFSVAYHFLQSSALAEEIAQDIFLELYKNLSKIESPTHLVWWLRRSTTNRCIDHSRKLAYRMEVPISDTFHPATCGDIGDAFLEESLRRNIAKLPEWQRAVVILRYQEDLDPPEIADLLAIPVNTVKSRLHRALSALRATLERKQGLRA